MTSDSSTELANVTVNKSIYNELIESLGAAQPASGVITAATLSLLLGILSVLTGTAVYLLVHKGIGRLSIQVQIGCTLALCACSWAFCALQVARSVSTANSLAALAANIRSPVVTESQIQNTNAINGIDIASTAMLAISMVIGDGIVWWRACVIWPGNVLVRIMCAVLLLATSALAITSVSLAGSQSFHNYASIGSYFQNTPGTAAVVLSLTTNIIATLLIAFKTWQHWRLLRVHLGNGQATKRVLKILALLVESGVIYSVLLALITAWEGIGESFKGGHSRPSSSLAAETALVYILLGCLVPLIAMYPTLIIILVSLEQSPLERGFSAPSPVVPKPPPPSSIQMSETFVSTRRSGMTADLKVETPIGSGRK